MSRLDEFLRLLCGRFDNTRQLEELRRSGGPALPLAEHVNTVCNDKIDGLPADFAGAFVLEESYYTTEGKTHASPHLFLFTEEGEAVKLTSYQLPKAADGGAATYETLPPLKWEDLEISEKFTPALIEAVEAAHDEQQAAREHSDADGENGAEDLSGQFFSASHR